MRYLHSVRHLLLGTVLLVGGSLSPLRADAPTPSTLAPNADTFVDSRSPQRNSGHDIILAATNTAADAFSEAYLRFPLAGVTGTVTKATLVLQATSGNGTTQVYHLLDTADEWNELALTWANHLTGGNLLAACTLTTHGAVQIDVTNAVAAERAAGRNGILSLRLVSPGEKGNIFLAREDHREATRPRLILE